MSETPSKADVYTEELFQKIKDNKITIDPVVWDLVGHVLGNRIYSITLIVSDLLDTPKWILTAGSRLMMFLYKITGNPGKMRAIQEILGRAARNADQARDFMKRLREATKHKTGF